MEQVGHPNMYQAAVQPQAAIGRVGAVEVGARTESPTRGCAALRRQRKSPWRPSPRPGAAPALDASGEPTTWRVSCQRRRRPGCAMGPGEAPLHSLPRRRGLRISLFLAACRMWRKTGGARTPGHRSPAPSHRRPASAPSHRRPPRLSPRPKT